MFKKLLILIKFQFRIDIVELTPKYDTSGASTAVACKTLRELVLAIIK